MIDLKALRENPDHFIDGARAKGSGVDIPRLLELDTQRRTLLSEQEQLRSEQKKLGKEVGPQLGKLKGRVTFMPLSTGGADFHCPSTRSPMDTVLRGGRVTALRPLVRIRENAEAALGEAGAKLLDRLLGQTYLVENLEAVFH